MGTRFLLPAVTFRWNTSVVMAITNYSEVRKTTNLLTLFTLQMERVAKAAEAYAAKTQDESARMHANAIVKTIGAWLKGEKNAIY